MADLQFVGSYCQGYPEKFDEVLDSVTLAVVCSFNRSGALLAVGCNDGRLVIWDIITRNIVRALSAHVRPITSISWSRYGDYLLVGSADWSALLISMPTLDIEKRFQFNSPINCVEFNPRHNETILICVFREFPTLITLSDSTRTKLIDPDLATVEKCLVAKYDRRGKNIFLENVFSHRGRDDFLVNCHDKTIRLYRCQDVFCETINGIEPIQSFRDLVSKSIWRKCCFSNDGEYVIAGASRQHSIFIWERNTGGLVKMLNGTKGETLRDITVYYMVINECWSAYAPNFRELEQNVEYEEAEGEFDVKDEDKPCQSKENIHDIHNYSEYIDILTLEKPLYCSSDETGQELHINATCIAAEEVSSDKSDSFLD
ncbi:hypothetical protein HZS_2105 [Henneguya salminicola]|nr:hypothetical protein HZS_2105 [Henneguya salminicola]